MEDNTLYLEILTPEKNVFSGAAQAVFFPGADGYLGVLPGHAPLITKLGTGVITCRNGNGGVRHFFCCGGFAEVMGRDLCILADVAESEEEIDVQRAEHAKQRAGKRVFSQSADVDYHRANAALYRALNRLQTAGRG